jgi:hypothetical protein
MAEIQLTEEQEHQIGNLLTAIGQDQALRDRLQADPRAVFGEYGLVDLLPGEVGFEVSVGEPEVGGYALAGHIDGPHTDHHMNQPHTDYVKLGVPQIQIQFLPRIGPAR